MNPDTIEQAREVFDAVCDLPATEREGRLADAGSAVALRVRELLAAQELADELFGPLDESSPVPMPVETDELEPGTAIGVYRILGKAGRGGFGTVYLAEQTEPVTRRVALKVLRAGLVSDEAHARFDAERQALARMEHPGIARVFDAGTTDDGRPYFAMEFVAGVPITQYCAQRTLGLRERLELFRPVCHAIQHAHQKGVVHRDLKPSNVLVTEVDGAPYPKVIDFGIAKAVDGPLTDRSVVSIAGQIVGTPAYMSPEQAAGDGDVDTRADVYALGALLYELLAGSPPFDVRELGFARLLQAILDEEPPRPSARRTADEETKRIARVPADLDWIAMRCLEKERHRRYPSASALAEDVRRFLDGLPVDAAPPSRWYRLRKLTRRHRFAVAGSAAFLAVLVAGIAGTWTGLVRAEAEAERAREEADLSAAVIAFLNDDLFAAAVPSSEPGRGRSARLVDALDAATMGLESGPARERFSDKPRVEAAIRETLGSVYCSLGELAVGVRHLEVALALREAACGPDDPATLATASALGRELARAGRLAESATLVERAFERQRVEDPGDPATLASQHRLGLLRHREGRSEEAYAIYADALEAAADSPDDTDDVVLVLRGSLAITADAIGRPDEAERHFRWVLARRRERDGGEHHATRIAAANLASFLRAHGRATEAVPLYREVLETLTDVLGPDHHETLTIAYNLAGALADEGSFDESRDLLDRTAAGYESALGADHPDTLQVVGSLGLALARDGDREGADELLRIALEGTEAALGRMHPTTDSRRKEYATFLFREPERRDELAALLRESVECQTATLGARHPSTLRSIANFALLRQDEGDYGAAESMQVEVLEGFREALGPEHVETLTAESDLAALYEELGRYDESEALARHSVEAGARTLVADSATLARFRLRLAVSLRALGRDTDARSEVDLARAALQETRGAEHRWTRFAAELSAELEAAGQ